MHQVSSEMRACIDACLHCYSTCLGTAMSHCLEAGGKHTEPWHFRLMMACAEICRTSVHFMLIGSRITNIPAVNARKFARSAQKTAKDWATCRNAWTLAALAQPVAVKWQREAATRRSRFQG